MRKNGDDGVHISTPRSRSKADDGVHISTPRSRSKADDVFSSVALIFLPSPAQY